MQNVSMIGGAMGNKVEMPETLLNRITQANNNLGGMSQRLESLIGRCGVMSAAAGSNAAQQPDSQDLRGQVQVLERLVEGIRFQMEQLEKVA